MLKTFYVTLVFLFYPAIFAQDAAPSLTELQRLKVQTFALQMEIAQLKAQAAQRDFDAARAELTKLVESLQVKGYVLDLSTLTYQPIKE